MQISLNFQTSSSNWEKNCVWLFYYYCNFEMNHDNLNFNKNEIENGQSLTHFQKDKPCAHLRIAN